MHRCKTTWMWNCCAFWVQLAHWWYECRLSHLNELRELENDMKTTLVRARHCGKEHWLMTYWWFIWGSQTRRRHWSNLVHFFRWSWLGAGIDSSPYSPQTEGPSYGFERKRVDVESGKLSFFGLAVALRIELSLKGGLFCGNGWPGQERQEEKR